VTETVLWEYYFRVTPDPAQARFSGFRKRKKRPQTEHERQNLT